jgi:hypothetical protein
VGYEASSLHKIVVANTDTGQSIERVCDAAWWVSTPKWAQTYIYEGMHLDLVKEEEQARDIQAEAEEKAKERAAREIEPVVEYKAPQLPTSDR